MNAIRITRRVDSETLHLPELRPLMGRDVEIIVLDDTERQGPKPPTISAESKPIWQVVEGIASQVPPEDLPRLPRDGAEQHDHYIHGTPKRKA
jgi:hypothetical protein